MKRKRPVYKGLQFKPVWFEDTSLTSPEYLQITEFPTRLTAGKNLFKLKGHPTNLQINGLVNLEILDYNGDPIYHEVVNYLDDDKSRVVAIYIYEDTPAGDCTITVLTEAVNVPAEWKDRYNIRWTRSVPINPNISNSSEIIFENEPTLIINEQIGPHLNRVYSSGIQFPTYNTGTVRYFLYNKTPAIEIIGGKFSGDMVNGTITITSPVNATPTPNFPPATTQYSSTIKKVLSDSLILLDTDYTVYSNKSLSTHTFNSFDSSTFNLTYEQTPSYIATQNSESYALIEITGLEPATGDVSRIKMYMNNKGTVGTWEPINDIELGETEIFVNNTSSLYPDQSIGLFTSQSIIDTYWYGFTYLGKTVGTAPTLTWNTSSLNNAMYIQNNTDISAKNAVTVIKSTIGGTFIEDSGYKIVFDALGIRTTGDPKIAIYLSGSAFSYDSTDYFNQEFPEIMGKRIGELTVKTNNQRFDDIKFNFKAANTGTATLILVVESGDWKISDIRTTSDNDIGYTPNYTRIKTLVPTAHKINNQLSFKAEYYNINGERSKQISYYYNKDWEGGNRYIDGNYSMLTGSLYVADSLNSGVAISGYPDSGFVRSLGYEGFEAGFPGFLLWSGSAMPNSLGTKGAVSYSGVGLELYANPDNYFRYATNPSELDVHTQTFFLGSTSPANFISGSNGNLQISSSNFNIDANGNVTANNIYLENVATADGFIYNTVTITDSNYTQYYRNYEITDLNITGSLSTSNRNFTTLVLDGSMGGSSGRQVRIERLPDYPIGTIIPPGYEFESDKGYDITIENFALHSEGGFSSLPIASWVAENDSNIKGADDFGFGGEMWDMYAQSFFSRAMDYQFINALSSGSASIMYGESGLLNPQLYNSSGDPLHSQILLMYYGNQYTFQRSTHGTTSLEIRNGFWQIMSTDSTIVTSPYFARSAKFGNVGVLIGGEGAPGSRFSDIHQTTPHPSAVLQLDPGYASVESFAAGSGSVFIPPRITTTQRDNIGNPVDGSIIYNSTTNKLQVCAGGSWVDLH